MAKVIICIHGRSNKPDSGTLKEWWKESIIEGLGISTTSSLGAIVFEMAYYADIHYKVPVQVDKDDEPYDKATTGSIKPYKVGILDRIRKLAGKWLNKPLDRLEEHSHLFSSLAREVSKKLLKDLGEYYSDNQKRSEINNRLMSLLIKYKDDEIILISHSMGTIVAYEVLMKLSRNNNDSEFIIEHFITMGSPLGLTAVKGNFIQNNIKVTTPPCVRGSWVNFSDPGDFVCLDSHLEDDYDPNSSKISVKDILVCNDYPGNEHKSYGYLRTPEFSRHLASLL